MRRDIEEAYVRVMRKHWAPAVAEGVVLRELTPHTASMYIKAVVKKWTGKKINPAQLFDFVEDFKTGYNRRRTWRGTIVLSNWHDLNHEFSHYWFWRSGYTRRNAGGNYSHHCDRHLEWEYTGADWICRRMLQPKPFTLD